MHRLDRSLHHRRLGDPTLQEGEQDRPEIERIDGLGSNADRESLEQLL